MITGGEPLLHPKVIEITFFLKKKLLDTGLIKKLWINSNLLKEAPAEIKEFIINFTPVDEKPMYHNTIFIHPDDLGEARPTQVVCQHYRKNTIVYSKKGYSLCCAGDAYMRLFELDFYLDTLPDNIDKFPCMDEVCQHCPFGIASGRVPYEKDRGRPISKIYQKQFNKNKTI